MSFNIRAGGMPSIIHVPASKSYANRALILASLKHGPIKLTGLPDASDVTFLVKALKNIGLLIHEDGRNLTIENSFPECEKAGTHEISVGEGGTTARFLASLLLLGKSSYTLILGDRLKDRPWNEFIELVKKLKGKAELLGNKLIIQGPIQLPGNLEVDCSKTTQFASGLQLATAFANTIVVPRNMTSSSSYWEMTQKLIEHFQHQSEFAIPLDWSSASYPMAFGALKQEMSLPGLHFDPYQADAKFFTLLSQLGIIKETEGGLKVKPHSGLKADVKLDVSDCLDLVPTLGFFLAHIEGTHELTGVQNLVHKESDRLTEVISLLEEFGFKAHVENDSLIIEGSSMIHAQALDLELPDDHRIVMAAALFLRLHQGGSLSPEKAVEKSYPDFFSLFR